MTAFLTQHILWIVTLMLSLGLASSLLGQRRPAGSTVAWILIIVLAPYLGIPLYLVFGGRKFKRLAAAKAPIKVNVGAPRSVSLTQSPRAEDAPLSIIEWAMDGIVAYELLLREIERATQSIRIVTFVVGSDPTGRAVVQALTRKALAGVEVCLLVDDLLFYRAPKKELAALRAAGGRVARFMPLLHLPFRGRSNLRNHRKIALFDGNSGFIGGMNLADEYMGPSASKTRWCDFGVLISGPAAKTMGEIFRADWLFATKQELREVVVVGGGAKGQTNGDAEAKTKDGVPMRIVPSGPDLADDSLYDSLVQSLFAAKDRIWISTPYFVPDEVLMKALELAAHRGVDVRIVVPKVSNHAIADNVAATYLRDLARAGAHVYRFLPTMLHAKAVIIDLETVSIGSANFDMRSFFLDFEIAALLRGEEPTQHLASWFETIFAKSELGPPIAGPLKNKLQSVIRLLAPLT